MFSSWAGYFSSRLVITNYKIFWIATTNRDGNTSSLIKKFSWVCLLLKCGIDIPECKNTSSWLKTELAVERGRNQCRKKNVSYFHMLANQQYICVYLRRENLVNILTNTILFYGPTNPQRLLCSIQNHAILPRPKHTNNCYIQNFKSSRCLRGTPRKLAKVGTCWVWWIHLDRYGISSAQISRR